MRRSSRFLKTMITVISALCVPAAAAQNDPEPGPSAAKLLNAAHRKVVLDSTPFSPGAFIPYWDKGYLVSVVNVDIFRPDMPTVRLYDANGGKVKEVSLWFDGPERIYVRSVAVSFTGRIVISGTAVQDGIRAPFIARFDDSGKVADLIRTSPFHPSNICVAADDTVWSFGSAGKDASEPILRQFAFQKGQVAAYLARSSFSAAHDPSSSRPPKQVYLRCTPNRVVVYTEVAGEYIEVEPATGAILRWELDRSAQKMPIRGRLAVTPSGDVFAVLKDRSEDPGSAWGLFHLQIDRPSGKARWLPVEGHVSDQRGPGAVTLALGADQDGIVFMAIGHIHTLSWARPRNRD